MEAMKRQGERTDLTSPPLEGKLQKRTETADIVGEKNGDSREQVRRYIRLTELVPEVLQMVDEGKIAFRPAVELSYLPAEQQQHLLETMKYDEVTPSLAQAIKMKQFSKDGRLNDDVILSIMSEEKPNQKEQFKIPRAKIDKFFPAGTSAQKIEDTIIKALELWRQRERNRDAR